MKTEEQLKTILNTLIEGSESRYSFTAISTSLEDIHIVAPREDDLGDNDPVSDLQWRISQSTPTLQKMQFATADIEGSLEKRISNVNRHHRISILGFAVGAFLLLLAIGMLIVVPGILGLALVITGLFEGSIAMIMMYLKRSELRVLTSDLERAKVLKEQFQFVTSFAEENLADALEVIHSLLGERVSKSNSVLFLTANPIGTRSLHWDYEYREIQRALPSNWKISNTELTAVIAVTTEDFLRVMNESKASLIHFAGHGEGRWDMQVSDKIIGLAFELEGGGVDWVDGQRFADLISPFAQTINCVFLNACSSLSALRSIRSQSSIPYLIGMCKPIHDEDSILFSKAFYRALFAGKSIDFAFASGISALAANSNGSEKTPKLVKSVCEAD